MKHNEILEQYISLADMIDLRCIAVEYAITHDWDELEIVTDEIKKRNIQDKIEIKAKSGESKKKMGLDVEN